jgi:MFS transporter, FSR family, fosmidomycin resistance protein
MDQFGLSTKMAQISQFVFFAAVAAGTIVGGRIGDKLGRRKLVIWVSILGVLPFTLILPHVELVPTVVLSVVIGFVLSSAFPAIVVYGQELMPGRVGMVSGLFFGFIFGIGGIGAALLGTLADWEGISFVFQVCAFLPAIGILAVFLPNLPEQKLRAADDLPDVQRFSRSTSVSVGRERGIGAGPDRPMRLGRDENCSPDEIEPA